VYVLCHVGLSLIFVFCFRAVYVDRNSTSVQLQINRRGYLQKIVMVTVITEQLSQGFRVNEAGLYIYAAIQGVDFARTVQTVVFNPGMVNNSDGHKLYS
jgi:hypothetical protein